MMVYERNYKLLDKVIKRVGFQGLDDYAERSLKALETEGSTSPVTINNPPYMPLHIEYIYSHVIAMSHTYLQNGDLMRDPEMEIRITGPDMMPGCVEALTYRQDGLGVYHEVYPEPGKVDPKRKRELNAFLCHWLNNLQDQGFSKGDNPDGMIPFELEQMGLATDGM